MKTFILLSTAFMLSACTSLLPTSHDKSIQPWTTFEEAKASYDKIELFVTDLEAVRKLGFDPLKTPNVKILNQTQVVQIVLPVPIHDEGVVPPGIRECIAANSACQGFHIESSLLNRKRVGSFILDFMNFKRQTVTTGWKFSALFVVVDDRVVYKQWSGSPSILEESVQKNPLGPLQGLGASSGLYYQ
jgi:hypothetical protein